MDGWMDGWVGVLMDGHIWAARLRDRWIDGQDGWMVR